jgi:AraC-like DNA-binding protein
MNPGTVLYETDTYREWAAPAPLQYAIACLWLRRGDGASVRVLPDGCTDIVWRPGTGAFIAGPDTGPVLSPTCPDELVLGVRLRPGAGGAAFAIPLAEIRDLRVSVAELGLDPAGELSAGLDPQTAVTRLTALATRLALHRPPDTAVQAATARLGHPRQRVETLAAELGFSERQLRRRFHDAVGYGPKTLQRVLRLQRFRALEHLDLAAAAAEAGYADQAHLTRDCRDLTGLTPRALRND